MTPRARIAALALAVLGLGMICGCSRQQPVESPEAQTAARFRKVVDDYFSAYFSFYPTEGSALGLHQYDSKLEDFAVYRMRERIDALADTLTVVQQVRKEKLSVQDSIDARLLEARVQAELVELRDVRSWRKNPMYYVRLPGYAVDQLMKRNFASGPERLRAIIARMKQIEQLLTAMGNNVTEPPREFTELGSRIASGAVQFFRDSVPVWARQAAGNDGSLYQEFLAINRTVAGDLEIAAHNLNKELLPLSTGSYAIGSDVFSRKLRYEEMVDMPLDRLLAIGEANLDKDYKAFLETAKRVGGSPREAMQALMTEHPSENELLDFTRATLESIRKFVVDKQIVGIPSDVRPNVQYTPAYARDGSFASMDTPGPHEASAKEAFYYVTPTESNWTKAHKLEHLRLFNKPVLDIITIHEAFPGHFVQFLYAKDFPTTVRKNTSVGTNAEGWAHYTEQMMLEEGYGAGAPKIKLAQLAEALIRDCRYVAGIRMHTAGMTVDQATRLFVEKAFMEENTAREEARRGAYNPTYLYYTLGKLQIYKLREDYRNKLGSAYSLGKFHSEFVKQGAIPIKLVREIMLPGDTGPTL